MDVKEWTRQLPSVQAARPVRCAACGAASAPAGQGYQLHGHGVRPRMRLGPEQLGERSVVGEITARRYRCQRCWAVQVVVPRGVLPRLRYGALAIALALALWSAHGLSAAAVRAQVSPFVVVGHEAQRGWRSLGRWARGSPWPLDLPDDATPKQRAAQLVQWLAGHALGPGSLHAQACAGALRA